MIIFVFGEGLLLLLATIILLVFGATGFIGIWILNHIVVIGVIFLILHALFSLGWSTMISETTGSLVIGLICALIYFIASSIGVVMAYTDAMETYVAGHEIMAAFEFFLGLFLFYLGPTAIWFTAIDKCGTFLIVVTTLLFIGYIVAVAYYGDLLSSYQSIMQYSR